MTKLVRVFSAIDESMVVSMLSSAEIAAVSDSTNFQRIQYGTMFTEMAGTTISVDSAFVKEAKEIVTEFIENKKRMRAEEALASGTAETGSGATASTGVAAGTTAKKSLRTLFAAMFATPVATPSQTSLPELIA